MKADFLGTFDKIDKEKAKKNCRVVSDSFFINFLILRFLALLGMY